MLGSRQHAYTVIIADGSSHVRETLALALQEEGQFQVLAAAGDGQAGLEAAARLSPDLLIAAMDLPGTDPVGLLEAVRALPRPPAVVLLSVRGTAEERRRAQAAGCAAHAAKSDGWPAVLGAVSRALGGGSEED